MSLKFGAAQAPAEQAGTPPTNYVIREPSPSTSILATLHATSTVSSSTSTISTELEGKHTWAYILVPLGAIVFLGFVIFLVSSAFILLICNQDVTESNSNANRKNINKILRYYHIYIYIYVISLDILSQKLFFKYFNNQEWYIYYMAFLLMHVIFHI